MEQGKEKVIPNHQHMPPCFNCMDTYVGRKKIHTFIIPYDVPVDSMPNPPPRRNTSRRTQLKDMLLQYP